MQESAWKELRKLLSGDPQELEPTDEEVTGGHVIFPGLHIQDLQRACFKIKYRLPKGRGTSGTLNAGREFSTHLRCFWSSVLGQQDLPGSWRDLPRPGTPLSPGLCPDMPRTHVTRAGTPRGRNYPTVAIPNDSAGFRPAAAGTPRAPEGHHGAARTEGTGLRGSLASTPGPQDTYRRRRRRAPAAGPS